MLNKSSRNVHLVLFMKFGGKYFIPSRVSVVLLVRFLLVMLLLQHKKVLWGGVGSITNTT
jgi:hypothetical protein